MAVETLEASADGRREPEKPGEETAADGLDLAFDIHPSLTRAEAEISGHLWSQTTPAA
jgi:hypothetical protein